MVARLQKAKFFIDWHNFGYDFRVILNSDTRSSDFLSERTILVPLRFLISKRSGQYFKVDRALLWPAQRRESLRHQRNESAFAFLSPSSRTGFDPSGTSKPRFSTTERPLSSTPLRFPSDMRSSSAFCLSSASPALPSRLSSQRWTKTGKSAFAPIARRCW